jgi:D-alanyl-D-alanine carboxypeptidase
VLPDGAILVAAAGWADLEAGTPMTPRARMPSASIGKTYVAAAAVALAREGVLDLDAPVSRWIGDRPWFARLPNRDAITLRHLLTHSAGLADHVHRERFAADLARRWREPDNPFPPEALVAYVLDLPPLFEAGTGWAYSDTGYILAGLVIEAATGRGWYEEITTRFLAPLDLTLTSPSDRRRLAGLVAGYTTTDNPFGFPAKSVDAAGALAWHPGIEWTGGGWVNNDSLVKSPAHSRLASFSGIHS